MEARISEDKREQIPTRNAAAMLSRVAGGVQQALAAE
jgi:hypothetical protein